MYLPNCVTKKNYNKTVRSLAEKSYTEVKSVLRKATNEIKDILLTDNVSEKSKVPNPYPRNVSQPSMDFQTKIELESSVDPQSSNIQKTKHCFHQ